MPFKINIGDKGKSWRFELESGYLNGKSLGDKIEGRELRNELEGYEFEITGGSDISGFPGIGLKKVLLKKGWGMRDSREGVRLRKTVRSKTISNKVVQVNLKALKHGKKHLTEIFPDQNKPKDAQIKDTKEEKAIEVAA